MTHTLQLNTRVLGDGYPLLILHGLLGMSDNWMTIGRALEEQGYAVHLPDLRNHGNSPHATTHRYTDMADDIQVYVETQGLEKFHLIGHSMGGKVGMIFSLLFPEFVEKLVVVDIAPSAYRSEEKSFHIELLDTLLALDLDAFATRGAVRAELEQLLGDRELALFLTKNIEQAEGGSGFRWKCNLPVLGRFIHHLHGGFEELEMYAPSPVKTLFIKGNNSGYYMPAHDLDRMLFFPESDVVGVEEAGHWVHIEQQESFLTAVLSFLENDA